MRVNRGFAALAAVGCVLSLAVAPVSLAQPTETPAAATESCVAGACHAYRVALRLTPHSVLAPESRTKPEAIVEACQECHGKAKRRDKQEGEPGCVYESFAFRDDAFRKAAPPADRSARCLTCHLARRMNFRASPHARAGVACNDCHEIHGDVQASSSAAASERMGFISLGHAASAVCARCHPAVLAQFELNEHHRIQEGVLDCTSCHDPHARQERGTLGGFKNDACGRCHADKHGPFVFEHPASRVEGCVACHTPHGSTNRHLLAFESVAEACLSCHVSVPGFHASFTLDTTCTNCHTGIHGSNLSPFFLR